METNGKDTLSWLHGLEDYLKFMDSSLAENYVHQLLSLNYSENPYFPLRKLIVHAKENIVGDSDLFRKAVDELLTSFEIICTESDKELSIRTFAYIAKLCNPDENVFYILHEYFKLYNNEQEINAISDAFSRSQIKSKVWLVEELSKIGLEYDNVVVMASWFGQLIRLLDKKLTFNKARLLELDKSACIISDKIFNFDNLDGYRVKSINADISALTAVKSGYIWNIENFTNNKVYEEKFLPNLIINTSAEHMTEEWYNQIRFKEFETNPIVAIQSNNLFDIPEHINCVHGIDHMKKKFPMKEILFEGELQLKGYKRVMLIGRP